ncbi:MAG: CopG family transcriptional regulator [Candidatus Shapirobacteria bacterium]|jgi:metal-responsive CopG/Arc/MetJ family transcriptional regulator
MECKTINISIPSPLYKAVGKRAKAEARTISGLVQEAVRGYLAKKQDWESIYAYGLKKGKKAKINKDDLEDTIDSLRS